MKFEDLQFKDTLLGTIRAGRKDYYENTGVEPTHVILHEVFKQKLKEEALELHIGQTNVSEIDGMKIIWTKRDIIMVI